MPEADFDSTRVGFSTCPRGHFQNVPFFVSEKPHNLSKEREKRQLIKADKNRILQKVKICVRINSTRKEPAGKIFLRKPVIPLRRALDVGIERVKNCTNRLNFRTKI